MDKLKHDFSYAIQVALGKNLREEMIKSEKLTSFRNALVDNYLKEWTEHTNAMKNKRPRIPRPVLKSTLPGMNIIPEGKRKEIENEILEQLKERGRTFPGVYNPSRDTKGGKRTRKTKGRKTRKALRKRRTTRRR